MRHSKIDIIAIVKKQGECHEKKLHNNRQYHDLLQ